MLGLMSGYTRRDIPVEYFSGAPFASILTTNRADRNLVFSVSLPIPPFDRQLQPRARALQAVADTPTVIERDAGFVEQAVRAGAFDALTRTVNLRRLVDAGRRVDTAVRDYRAATAAWLRRSLDLQQP